MKEPYIAAHDPRSVLCDLKERGKIAAWTVRLESLYPAEDDANQAEGREPEYELLVEVEVCVIRTAGNRVPFSQSPNAALAQIVADLKHDLTGEL